MRFKRGLVTSKKAGRSITYLATTALVEDPITYLVDNYCVPDESVTRCCG